VADSDGDFYRRAGSACDAARTGRVVQTSGRSAIRLEDLARLYPDCKLRADFDYSDAHTVAHQLPSPLNFTPLTATPALFIALILPESGYNRASPDPWRYKA